ncbi:hypothetical protein K1719_025239 [Acacia pycnantha]|nr:hypothetical protein K1719_025239 [Acacia pycnantha]
MQSTLLPKSVLHEIEKVSRNFLWCQDENARKMHLIAWQNIIKSKRVGGLGVGKKINNGKNTYFWWDMWTPLIYDPLIDYVQQNLEKVQPGDKVADFVLSNGRWNVTKWREFFPEWIVNILVMLPPPQGILARLVSFGEMLRWKILESKFAYNFLSHREESYGTWQCGKNAALAGA